MGISVQFIGEAEVSEILDESDDHLSVWNSLSILSSEFDVVSLLISVEVGSNEHIGALVSVDGDRLTVCNEDVLLQQVLEFSVDLDLESGEHWWDDELKDQVLRVRQLQVLEVLVVGDAVVVGHLDLSVELLDLLQSDWHAVQQQLVLDDNSQLSACNDTLFVEDDSSSEFVVLTWN